MSCNKNNNKKRRLKHEWNARGIAFAPKIKVNKFFIAKVAAYNNPGRFVSMAGFKNRTDAEYKYEDDEPYIAMALFEKDKAGLIRLIKGKKLRKSYRHDTEPVLHFDI